MQLLLFQIYSFMPVGSFTAENIGSLHYEVFAQAEMFLVLLLPIMKTFLVSHLHALKHFANEIRQL